MYDYCHEIDAAGGDNFGRWKTAIEAVLRHFGYPDNVRPLKSSLHIVLLVLCAGSVLARNPHDSADTKHAGTDAYITWVNQYPIPQAAHKHAVLHRLLKMFIGERKELSLKRPVALVATDPHTITLLDQGNQTVFDIAGTESGVPRCIRKKEQAFSSLAGICSLPGGTILFTDSRQNKIFRMSADRRHIRPLNDSLVLQQPTGIAWSPVTGEIWVTETAAHSISVLDSAGRRLRTIGKRGGDTAEFNFPTSLSIGQDGDVYVVDAMNFRVQVLDKNGNFISVFGEAGDASGYMARPKGIATDSYGNIYVSDALFHAVQIFNRKGDLLYTFGRQGTEKEEFWMPEGIYIDSRNYIYVADTYNSRIQVFQLINGG